MNWRLKRTLQLFGLALGAVVPAAGIGILSVALHFPRVWPGVVVSAFIGAANAVMIAYSMGERAEPGWRYRLAWQQARQRAQNHLDALIESDEECAALRAELRARDEAVR